MNQLIGNLFHHFLNHVNMSNETDAPVKEVIGAEEQGRRIILYSTKGKKQSEVFTDVKEWGDLKPLVKAQGYDLSKLIAAENVNRTTLEHEQARLPEGEFTLFMRPKKTKSGLDVDNALKFTALRNLIREYPGSKDFLNEFIPGKNWTQLRTDELRAGLQAYNPSGGTDTVIETASPATGGSVSPSYNGVANVVPVLEKAAEAEGLSSEMVDDINDVVDFINEQLLPELKLLTDAGEIARRKVEEEAKAKAAMEAARKEEERKKLATEADNFLSGF